MKRTLAACSLLALMTSSGLASADTFPAGSIIIPMDTTHQDQGMFKAYGLVYQLLRSGVPVHWAIKQNKTVGEADFVADATDLATNGSIVAHGYRGGPWIISAADAMAALPIVQAWQSSHAETTAHLATSAITADVAKTLVAAPRVAMFADGNQKIARGYLQAAGIADSLDDLTWPDSSPDMLDPAEVSGPTTTSHSDGALFDEDGDPAYCQFMSMHWGVNDALSEGEVVAEVRQFLSHPTHFFAECQAVNAFENHPVHGFFLTPNGFNVEGKPNSVWNVTPDSPFAQLDGGFETVGGSEPAYSLPLGDVYKGGGVSLLSAVGAMPGEHDVWMTGYLDGVCNSDVGHCFNLGKVSYLGGHSYKTDLPISDNPDSQGTRLFLNSLFDSECASAAGAPVVMVTVSAPSTVSAPEVTYSLTYANTSGVPAYAAVLQNALPTGTSFVTASNGGSHDNGVVSWPLGNLGKAEGGTVTVTVALSSEGMYTNHAELLYDVGLTPFSVLSNDVQTTWSTLSGEGGAGGGGAGGEGAAGGFGGEPGAGGAGAGSETGSGSTGASGGGEIGGTSVGGSSASGPSAGGSSSNQLDGDASDSGGCACHVVGERDLRGGWLALMGLVALGARRRRRP